MRSPRDIAPERMVTLRDAQGYTQSSFARAVGVDRQLVYKWDKGISFPSPDEIKQAATALKTSVSYLYGETDDPRPAKHWHGGPGPSSATEATIAETLEDLQRAQERLRTLMPTWKPEAVTDEQAAQIIALDDLGEDLDALHEFGNQVPVEQRKRAALKARTMPQKKAGEGGK